MKKINVLCAVSAGLFASACQSATNTLEAIRAPQAIVIDGTPDAFWDTATALTVRLNELPYEPNNGYQGITETDIELRAAYDDESVYFLMRWEDPTHSLERFPWVKQPDGTWKQLSNKDDTGHDNTYYEDKLALFWNIRSAGFAKKGCDKSCHITEDGVIAGVKTRSAGRHFTASRDETLDIWHWKSARSNPVGQVDDQYLNADREQNKGWGRHSDDKTEGGYSNNSNAEGSAPAWMNPAPSNENRYWVMGDTKVPFVDTFKPGDGIGGIVANAAHGSRGDIHARGVWKDGVWSLEIQRKLTTAHSNADTQDIQFSDLSRSYLFGISVFDNSQINHLYHKKALTLKFAQ